MTNLSATYIYNDPFITGWHDQDVRDHLGFDMLDPATRRRHTPISPFSIVRETRRGVTGFVTTDMRTGRRLRVKTQRAAVRVAKLIEADYFTAPSANTLLTDPTVKGIVTP